MEIRLERLVQNIEAILKFNGTPGQGYTRPSYSPEDQQARQYFRKEFDRLGLKTRVDGVGNIRARLEGSDPTAPVVMVGSHIDTVPHGGKYDGLLGVAAALEVITVLVEHNVKTLHPVEIIIFAEEEGSNFGSTMAGSKAATGRYTLADLQQLKNGQGISMYEMARDFQLDIDRLAQSQLKPGDVKAMLEMHIEQGAVLDSLKIPVGIVESMVGSKLLQVEVKGVSNHAGTTPMHLRKDPMVAAAKMIAAVEKIVYEKGLATTVGTVGKIECQPNVPNCIPGKVIFTIDIRDITAEGIAIAVQEIVKVIQEISDLQEVDVAVAVVAESNPIFLSNKVIKIIEQVAKNKGIPYLKISSGAVHDSSMMAALTDVGMIFVPSIGGRSHTSEEDTHPEDIKLGSDVLLEAVLALANETGNPD